VLALDDAVGAGERARLQRRLVAFVRDLTAEILGGLVPGAHAELSAAARGLVYQLGQGLGTVRSRDAAPQLAALTDADRALLAEAGVVLGERVVYVAAGLTPERVNVRLALARAFLGADAAPERPPAGAASFRPSTRASPSAWLLVGYPLVAERAIRADVLERLSRALARAANASKPLPSAVCQHLGCSRAELSAMARALGHVPLERRRRRRRTRGAPAMAKVPSS
jgi:ATP-dependent RNA helicase SUPV3L1/SUV3